MAKFVKRTRNLRRPSLVLVRGVVVGAALSDGGHSPAGREEESERLRVGSRNDLIFAGAKWKAPLNIAMRDIPRVQLKNDFF